MNPENRLTDRLEQVSGSRSLDLPLAMLEIGLSRSLFIREERISNRPDACRLLYVSDIHLRRGRSDRLGSQVVETVKRCSPDAVLLGGDLVDSSSELLNLTALVAVLNQVAPVLAVGGNHDRGVGIDRVRAAVVDGGGQWIHSGSIRLTHGFRQISIFGPEAGNIDDGDVRVLCAHNPRVWRTSRSCGYDLVLAGHLHGCQLVAFEYRDRLFPGAWFYPYCYLSHQSGTSRLVVSRGVSDLVPIRWRCPREVVLCYI